MTVLLTVRAVSGGSVSGVVHYVVGEVSARVLAVAS